MSKKETLITALNQLEHPKQICPLGDPKVLHKVSIDDGDVTLIFKEPPGSYEINDLKPSIENIVFQYDWVESLEIGISLLASNVEGLNPNLDNVKHVIAVSSCKGGVGKSTVSVNLAAALAKNGAQVGIFDADIYGPSLPTILNPQDIATTLDDDLLPTFINNNIKLMSYGYIQSQAEQPAILRGPIASNLLKQLLFKTDWGYLDYLIIDCPPGTGDIMLSITQELKLSGAIVVSTPHELAVADVEKGIEMFQKVNVPILGLVENMSYFICDDCTNKHRIFGSSPLKSLLHKHSIRRLYEFPLTKEISNHNNKATPLIQTLSNDNETLATFNSLANDIVWSMALASETDNLIISFNNDKQILEIGNKSVHYRTLRAQCKCAYCVDELTGEQLFNAETMDPKISIKDTHPVGHYAYQVNWLEHGKPHPSMYTIKELRSLID